MANTETNQEMIAEYERVTGKTVGPFQLPEYLAMDADDLRTLLDDRIAQLLADPIESRKMAMTPDERAAWNSAVEARVAEQLRTGSLDR